MKFTEETLINNYELNKESKSKLLAHVSTFGCQMNSRDSEKIYGMLDSMGYESTESENEADVVVYNTCCIRENAENKVFGKLGYLKTIKRKKPHLKIVLCGCMMQQDFIIDIIKEKYSYVDVVFGTFNLSEFPQLLKSSIESSSQVIDIWKSQDGKADDLPSIRKYKYKAGVNIMYGCDNFCSYCIVPYVRGRERSRTPDEIIDEIKFLASDGVKEIMLLGQNVNSYGKKFILGDGKSKLNADAENINFPELLQKVCGIEGIERIRFMTSHPKDLSDSLIDVIASNKKICNHIHLPVQSGSTKILEKMNRKYTKDQYLDLIGKIKSRINDIFITTDIIVGFPTETEEDFLETMDLVKKARFFGGFTFIYSKRSGTPASKYDEIDKSILDERFRRLLKEFNNIVFEINDEQIGKTLSVLVEDESKKEKGIFTGKATNNSVVHFNGDSSLIGNIVNIKIKRNGMFFLEGELV